MHSKREEVKEHIHNQILDAAFEEFAENGYTKTTLAGIAKRADFATGIVNKYFESKEKLFLTLIDMYVLSSVFSNTESCTLDEAFDCFLDGIKSAITANKTRAKFDRMLVSSTDLPFDTIEYFVSTCSSNSLLSMIEDAQNRGIITSEQSAAALLFALYKGTVIISRWYKELGLSMPDNDSLLYIIAYKRPVAQEASASSDDEPKSND